MKFNTVSTIFQLFKSPSVWREWIEIQQLYLLHQYTRSPSVWREWIEMATENVRRDMDIVSLRVEGVD